MMGSPHTRRAGVLALTLMSAACAGRATVQAPTAGHVPEPVPPVMMPAPPVVAPPTARAIVARMADSAVSAPMWRNARWGMLIVDATTGDTLVAHDADKLFVPASNEKVLTTAIALQLLGPEYRWRTPVLLRGEQRGPVFRGDIVVIGRGDPTVSESMHAGDALAAFEPVADALRARGITRVTGSIITSGDAFTGQTSGYAWEIDDLDTPSGAAVDELLFNEGLLHLVVRGAAKAGTAPSVQRAPTAAYPPLRIEATTRLATDTGARLDVAYDTVAGALRVTGTIPVGDSVRLSASYRHPNDAYRAALAERLLTRGIRVAGGAPTVAARAGRRGVRAAMPPREDTLVTLESAPLREVLPRLLKPSQNQLAEIFFRTSGLVTSGSGEADSARAVGARTLAAMGVTGEQVAYRDGSGMSRHDYVSPRALVRVLDTMHRSAWADLYRQSMPQAGVDGTIANRMKNTPAAGNASAKTGTLDKTRSLSGYVNSADGHVVIFALLCNSFTVPNREVERVQDLLVSTLAGMQLGVARGR